MQSYYSRPPGNVRSDVSGLLVSGRPYISRQLLCSCLVGMRSSHRPIMSNLSPVRGGKAREACGIANVGVGDRE